MGNSSFERTARHLRDTLGISLGEAQSRLRLSREEGVHSQFLRASGIRDLGRWSPAQDRVPFEAGAPLHAAVLPHSVSGNLFMQGATGSGKSLFLSSTLLAIRSRFTPASLKMDLFDFKGCSTFSLFEFMDGTRHTGNLNYGNANDDLLLALALESAQNSDSTRFIALDEFPNSREAELQAIIDAARGNSHILLVSGQSLGAMHTVMKAQGPKVSLRVPHAIESTGMLGSPDAVRLRWGSGEGLVKYTEKSRLLPFQAPAFDTYDNDIAATVIDLLRADFAVTGTYKGY